MMSTNVHSAIIMLMLWFQRGKAKVENKTVPTGKTRSLSDYRSYLRPKRVVILLLALALLAVAATWFGQWYKDYQVAKNTVYFNGESKYFKDRKSNLLDNPPKENAPVKDKLAYLDKLRYTYAELGESKLAAETFEKRIILSKDDLNPVEYIWAAEMYHKSGNDSKAKVMLDTADNELLKNTNNIDSMEKVDLADKVKQLRSEYKL